MFHVLASARAASSCCLRIAACRAAWRLMPRARPIWAQLAPSARARINHETRSGVECLSGVSQSLQMLHGSLRSTTDRLDRADGPTDPPPGGGACLGAHDNTSCHRIPLFRGLAGKHAFTRLNSNPNSANKQLADASAGGVLGASSGTAPLISSLYPGNGSTRGCPQPKRMTPATLQRPGV